MYYQKQLCHVSWSFVKGIFPEWASSLPKHYLIFKAFLMLSVLFLASSVKLFQEAHGTKASKKSVFC